MDEIYSLTSLTINQLVEKIATGELGLPDLQRPFIWKGTKVRDLFDSLLKGFPIGYLMIWDCPVLEDNRAITTGKTSYSSPKEVIIDGQQRLTSLFAVFKGLPVLNDKFEEVNIRIAYNPLTNEFEVPSSAIQRNPEWIGNISDLFTCGSAYAFITKYISTLSLSAKRLEDPLTDEEIDLISNRIDALSGIRNRSFPVFQINANVDEEMVSEIFVRVNSGGVTLKQNDFILTLMSLYWAEGRDMIENFCRSSTRPILKKTTAYNPITIVSASDIIRVLLAFGFYRGRMKYGYKLLRGADFEKKGAVSEDLKKDRFEQLKKILPLTIDLSNWHEFIKAIMSSGYLSEEMILSKNALFYTYSFFLLAKYRFSMALIPNSCLTSVWFFFSALTSQYTGSFESTVERQLTVIKQLDSIEEFSGYLTGTMQQILTDDYFKITLPGMNGLNVSGRPNNAWYAYVASLNVLNTPVLFAKSTFLVKDLFQIGIDGKKKSLERHHLFPKAYLRSKGYSDTLINQMANYALIDWGTNIRILDAAPSVYYPILCKGMDEQSVLKMEQENALPHGWENMDYEEFLKKRRVLMAEIIQKAFQVLMSKIH